MSEVKFTPGPWTARGLMVTHGLEVVVHCGTSNNFKPPRPHECAANAHLIAAAPELYEALDHLLTLTLFELDGTGNTDKQPWKLNIERAQAALSKAQGQTQ